MQLHAAILTFSHSEFLPVFTHQKLSLFVSCAFRFGDLHPVALRNLEPKNKEYLYAGHIHTVPTECVCVCHLGGLIVGSAHSNSL